MFRAIAGLLIAAVSALAVAQAPNPPVRIRGTVEKLDEMALDTASTKTTRVR